MSSRHGRSCHRGRGRNAQAEQVAATAAAADDQTRQQLLDAALHPTPRHTYSSDDEDDEDFAEFRKQAAQLVEQVKLGPVLPEGLEPGKFATALQQLQQHLSISQEVASDALLATAEQHWRDYDMWLDEAQLFLACRQETDIEAGKMREAMEASIRERDQQRQQEEQSRPELTNLSEERLRKRFAGSGVLQQLSSAVPSVLLFCDCSPLFELTKCQLVALLRLEERCCRWWPGQGTLNYFSKFAERCMSELQSGTATRSSSSTHIALMDTCSTHQQQQQQQVSLQEQQQLSAATRGLEANVEHLCTPSPQQQQPQQHQYQGIGITGRMPPPDLNIKMATGSFQSDKDSKAGGGSHLSAGSAAMSAAAASADDERRCSKRKRQAPERYRSTGCQLPAQQKARRRAGSTPPHCCSSECEAKHERQSVGADPGSRAASEPVAAAALPPATARPAAGCATSCAAAAGSYARAGSSSAPAAAAGAGRTSTRGTSVGAAQDALQLQLLQLQLTAQQAAGGSDSNLSSRLFTATAVQQLSKLLSEECEALQSMIYSFPSVAGAVPAIFKADAIAAAAQDEDGSNSDVEITAETQVAVPPAAAAPSSSNPAAAAYPDDGQADDQAAALAAVSSPVKGSPPDSPRLQLPNHQQSMFAATEYQRSPSVEIISE